MPPYLGYIPEQSTISDQILEHLFLHTYLEEGNELVSERLDRILFFLELLKNHNKIFLFAVEFLHIEDRKRKSINLRSSNSKKISKHRILFDNDSIGKILSITNKSKIATLVTKLDIATTPGAICLREPNKISGTSVNMFNQDIDIFTSNSTKEEEYVSISYNSFKKWNDENTKVIRSSDEGFKELTSIYSSDIL